MPVSLAKAFVAEFDHECAGTRKMLERVPEDKLTWKPHEKSMSLAQLTGHIAEMPGWAGSVMSAEELDFAKMEGYQPTVPETKAELLEAFDKSVASFRQAMEDHADEDFFVTWTMRNGEHVIAEMPRVSAIRGFVLSHTYHHRGQLSVYLRLLDVPLPKVYGPTADTDDDTYG